MNLTKKAHFIGSLLCILFVSYLHGQTNDDLQRYDIVISEIMADPTPAVSLPAVEYVELHNRLPYRVTFANWTLKIGNYLRKLPVIHIDSAGYTVLIAEKNAEIFRDIIPNIYTVSSLSLTDAGQTLVLYNSFNEVIHTVSYRSDWHQDPIKRDGGWSFEMIDEQLPCLESGNWTSSIDIRGGTPASVNSVQSTLSDGQAPALERITMLDSLTVRLFFTEPVRPDLPIKPSTFEITPNIAISDIEEVEPAFRAIDLHIATPLSDNVIYSLKIMGDIPDCSGNNAAYNESLHFGVPRHPQPHDLVINEILTHPAQGTNADYVEIYNRSPFIIDLKDIKIGSGGDVLPEKASTAVYDGYQLLPAHYFVFCKNLKITKSQYYCPNIKALWQCDSLPSYAISSGVVHLTDHSLQSIDKFAYTEDMHYAQLLTTEGVSLERVRFDGLTQDVNNWRSAAATYGFGTPGYRNSQAGDAIEADKIAVIPQVFSPDNDGYHDYTEFVLTFEEPENRLTITLYNEHGFPVKHLVNNELCGTEAIYRWDGLDDHNAQLPPGFYLVQLKWWNIGPNGKGRGNVHSRKKVVGIAAT